MKILITGASGHIGYHLCKLAVAKGYQVKAFVRPSSYKNHLLQLPIEICYGDILEIDTLRKAVEGVEAVFHTAAIYELTEEEKDNLIIKTSIEGTRNLYQASYEKQVKKIVYTSSVETVGLSYNINKLLSESSFAAEGFYVYSAAKVESERVALKLAKKFDLPTVICNPSTVIGKEDYKLTPSNKMLLNYVKYNLFYVDGGQSLVDVEDVARGHLSALLKGKNMERYILSGENIEVKDLIILIKRILNIKSPLFKLNKFLLYPIAFICEAASRLTINEPFLTRRKVKRAIGSYSYYDCSKAREELSYFPKNLTETLPFTLHWLMERYR